MTPGTELTHDWSWQTINNAFCLSLCESRSRSADLAWHTCYCCILVVTPFHKHCYPSVACNCLACNYRQCNAPRVLHNSASFLWDISVITRKPYSSVYHVKGHSATATEVTHANVMKHYRAKTLGTLPTVASTVLCNRSRVTYKNALYAHCTQLRNAQQYHVTFSWQN